MELSFATAENDRSYFRPFLMRESDPEVRAKLHELLTRTVAYNRDLARLHRELKELRGRKLETAAA